MKRLINVLISCILAFPFSAASAQGTNDSTFSVMNNIEYGYFFEHLKYLASDDLKGRMVGSEGFEKATCYVAEELLKNGLQPFGDSATYFQRIEFLKPSIVRNSIEFHVEKNSELLNGNFGKNVSLLISAKSQKVDEKQKLVFVGYGNIIPEEKINDYEGVDVRGRTVIVAIGGPKQIKNHAFNDIVLKVHNAIKQGATGIILFYPQGKLFQNLIFNYVHAYLTKGTLYYSDTSIHGSMPDVNLKLCIYAKSSFIRDILKMNGLHPKNEFRSIEKGRNMSKDLDMSLSCSYSTNVKRLYSKNVVSVIHGSDSALKNEYVVVGAHLDHLGVGKKMKGDSIYNGMIDNASGCAAALSIGKTFSQLSEKPKRSIIFIFYTAEEEGLLGSHYFANRNKIVNGRIVANLNLDMIANTFEATDIVPIGYLNSNLSEAVDYSTKKLNLTIAISKKLEEDYVERGDQFSFIKKDVPSLFIIPGVTSVDPKVDGAKLTDIWLIKKYHSPFDDLNQKYSEKAFLTAIKLNFLTLNYIANMDNVKWNKVSWFRNNYVLSGKK